MKYPGDQSMTRMGQHTAERQSQFVELRSVLHQSTVGATPGTARYYAMSEAAYAALPSRIPEGFENLPAHEISICLLAAHYRATRGDAASFASYFSTSLTNAVDAKSYPLSLHAHGERVLMGDSSDIFVAVGALTDVGHIESLIPYACIGVGAYDLVQMQADDVPLDYAVAALY